MKLLLTTIAAVVLVGCGMWMDIWAAARTGKIELVEDYLAKGVKVNAKDEYGKTPLHHAVMDGVPDLTPYDLDRRMKITELLIAKGADINAMDNSGHTPLDVTGKYFYPSWDIARLVRKHGGKHGSIHSAAMDGDINAVKEFLANGTNVSEKDEYGNTPLHFAARFSNDEMVNLLISKSADVNTAITSGPSMGQTPLEWAEDNPEIFYLLRKHGGKTGEELKAEGK